jgi:hypothetical protein
VPDIFGLESLFAELVLAIGAALLVGNALALWHHRRGRSPARAEGPFRSGRVAFLLVVGGLMTIWGTVSLVTGG